MGLFSVGHGAKEPKIEKRLVIVTSKFTSKIMFWRCLL